MNRIIEEITRFVFVEDTPRRADLIIAVGGSFPQIPEKAAELYNLGFADKILTTGRFSHNLGHFRGVTQKREIYRENYFCECDFYRDVLTRNGVPADAIIREDESEYTRRNAEYSRKTIEALGIPHKTLLIICKSYHARRCLMSFAAELPESELLIIPNALGTGEDKDDWFKSEAGIKRVLGELRRCGEQFSADDFLKG